MVYWQELRTEKQHLLKFLVQKKMYQYIYYHEDYNGWALKRKNKGRLK